MVVQNFPAGLNLFGCRFLGGIQIRLKKNLRVLCDSVVKKNKTKYLKGVPKVHPFPRLQTDGFWHRVTKPGYNPDKDYNVTSISKLNEIDAGASGAAGGEIILFFSLFL